MTASSTTSSSTQVHPSDPAPISRAPARAAASDRPERVLSTLNKDGSRRWLKPRLSKGRFLTWRRVAAWALIAIFTLLPYLKIGAHPAILLDLTTRRFHILGTTFLPTDTILLALLLVGTFVTIFLLTALLGRVWCGWACPQTVYMEFVFRPIERLFDGPPTSTPRSRSRGFRGSGIATVLKYVAFFLVSAYLAHTFLAYFVGVEQLSQWVRRSPFEHPAGFLIVASVTALMMFDFCFFREQTCIVACPYGRFQSVMLDRHSMIISYDATRGEPRGKKASRHQGIKASSEAACAGGAALDASMPLPLMPSSRGDCIDCHLCVTTCPTGIDIREGLQMECIGCAQCIDACDAVMDKIERPCGLIRYSSQSAMAGERKRILRPRVVIYPLLLIVLASLFGLALGNRGDAYVTVLRGLGRTFTELPSGQIANPVRIKIVNRTDAPRIYTIAIENAPGATVSIEQDEIRVAGGETLTVPAMIITPFEAFAHGKCTATLVVSDDLNFTQRTQWQLMGPGSNRSTTDHGPSASSRTREHDHED